MQTSTSISTGSKMNSSNQNDSPRGGSYLFIFPVHLGVANRPPKKPADGQKRGDINCRHVDTSDNELKLSKTGHVPSMHGV